MSESNKPFVITDRRKFNKDGEPRPDVQPAEQPAEPVTAVAQTEPVEVPSQPTAEAVPPPPTTEQLEQSRLAYQQIADRLDVAIRAANPGVDHPPPMDFQQLVQSLYLTSIMQMGGGTPEGEQARVDILGARQSIDMLAVVGDKTKGNLSPEESRLLESALFELRMAFLEITQALTRSAAGKSPGSPPKPGIVR